MILPRMLLFMMALPAPIRSAPAPVRLASNIPTDR